MRDGRVGNRENVRNVREIEIICQNIAHTNNGAIRVSLANQSRIRSGREITSRPALRWSGMKSVLRLPGAGGRGRLGASRPGGLPGAGAVLSAAPASRVARKDGWLGDDASRT